MTIEFNRDAGTIENFHKNNDGYLEIGVVTGLPNKVLDYGDRKETISLDALKSVETLKTLVGKPLTINHPNVAINATNRKKYEVGVFLQNTRLNNDGVPIADALITDADTIKKIVDGEITHVSMGYYADKKLNKDGIFEQLNRNYNHGALLDSANVPRAGSESKLFLQKDSLELELVEKNSNEEADAQTEKTANADTDKKTTTITNTVNLGELKESQIANGDLTSTNSDSTTNKRPIENKPQTSESNQKSSMQLDAKEIANRVELISEWKSVLDEEGVSINYDADTTTIKKQILSCYYPKEVLNQLNQDSIGGFWLGFVSEHYIKRENERKAKNINKDSANGVNYDADTLRSEYVKLICG